MKKNNTKLQKKQHKITKKTTQNYNKKNNTQMFNQYITHILQQSQPYLWFPWSDYMPRKQDANY